MADKKTSGSKRTIMVVDDDPYFVDIGRIILEENGFNVRCAYSGLEFLAGLEE